MMKKITRPLISSIFFLLLGISALSQNTYQSILDDIKHRNGIEIGEVHYILSPPGWWQYYPSCDASKWISVGDNFEPRGDYRARCDLQVNDFESVVAPTLSETAEFIVPANGRLILFLEVKEEEGYELEPWIKASLHQQDNIAQIGSIAGGKSKSNLKPQDDQYGQANKGDKVILKIENRMRGDGYRRLFLQCDATLKAFLIPLDRQPFPPEVIQAAKQNVNSGVLSNPASFENPGYDHVSHGSLFDETDNKTISKNERVYFGHRLKNTSNETVWVTLSGSDDSKRTTFALKPNTVIVIKKGKNNSNKSGVFLAMGRLFNLFTNKNTKGGYAVETYNSVSGVEGTTFENTYDEITGTTTLTVYEGEVSFSCKNSRSLPLIVTAGMTASYDKNCTPKLNPTDPSINTPQKAGWKLPITKPASSTSGKGVPLIADSHVYAYSYSNWNNANWGKYEQLGAGWNPIGGEKRTYLKFDLSGINPNTFEKATLKLYHNHTGGENRVELGVYPVHSPWIEGRGTYKPASVALPGELTWNNQPEIAEYPTVYFNPGQGINKWIEVDVTTMVKAWLNGFPNHGIAIKAVENYLNGAESVYGFYSREFTDANKRPQLIINDAVAESPNNNLQKKQNTSEINSKAHKIASFEIPNKGGKYDWEHTQNISIPGEGAVVFEAKTISDLTIGFAENITDRNSMYEIVIGAFGNAKALIRKGAQTPPQGHAQVTVNTNKMASVPSNQWISYWACVKDGLVKFGRGKMVGQNIILEWQDPNPLRDIRKIGFSSWNTPIKFRNVAIYNTANPVSKKIELNNWPETEIEESMTIEKNGGTYSWKYLNNVQISGNTAFSFEAKATEDLTVCLAEERDNKSAMYEIVIGGWGNTRTVIRKFRQNPQFGFANVTVNENPDAMVNSGEWEKYWISVKNGLVSVGKGNEIGRRIILEWQDPNNPLEFISTIGLMCWNRPYEIRNLKIYPIN